MRSNAEEERAYSRMQAYENMEMWKKPVESKRLPAHPPIGAPPRNVGANAPGLNYAPGPRVPPRGVDMRGLDLYDELERGPGRLQTQVDAELELWRTRETPLPEQYSEVILRTRETDQQKRKGHTPASFETVATTAGYPDDDLDDDDDADDMDYYDYMESPNIGGRSPLTAAEYKADELAMDKMEDIYQTYLANPNDNSGVTIMLRDIPYRLQVEPDIFRILHQTVDLNHVDYVYLPMTIEGVSTRSNVQPRNKGYCFIHFSVEATAHAFANRVQDYVIPDTFGGKTMFASRAKFQGLSMNLINLLDIQSKKWRPKHGVAHIRASSGELLCVGLLPLRNLFKKRSVRSGWQGAKAAGQQSALAVRPSHRP
jgi:hypothetical protein